MTALPDDPGRFLTIDGVIERTGLSRPTIYRLIAAGTFPKGVPLLTAKTGDGTPSRASKTVWPEVDVIAWQQHRLKQQGWVPWGA